MAKASSKAIRLLVIDDHALFRESIARLLQAEGFEVIASCGSCADARKAVDSWTDIDVVLLDFDLGSEKAADFIDFLGASRFPGKILLVTAGVNDNEAFTLMRQGISGIFLKHGFPSSLTQGIRDAIDGKVLFDQEMLQRVLRQSEKPAEPTRTKLTERERQVLSFVFEGLANKQIADRLHVSETAVKGSLQQLFAKTGVRTRSQLVRVALESYRDQL
jgi:two-component system, NarL family, nitrate/nitrite response regulator NarL